MDESTLESIKLSINDNLVNTQRHTLYPFKQFRLCKSLPNWARKAGQLQNQTQKEISHEN